MTPKLRHLPPRRLLAVAAALALISGQVDASSAGKKPKASYDGTERTCPLGTFICPPRPDNFALCRPNDLLEFYDPTLTKDKTLRATANTYAWAEHVDSSDQTVYHLMGRVKIDRADQRIQADRADYNDDTTDYDARGNVRYQEAGTLISADHMKGNDNTSQGVATGHVRYQMLDKRGNGVAVRGEMLDVNRKKYTTVTYSTCDAGHHLWEIRAKNITTDDVAGQGVARSATMRFANVPFIYLPYFTFPIDNTRQSGFLSPTFSHTGNAGYMISAPYYLNLAPNYDATLDPRIYSERGPMLAGQLRYLFPGTTGLLEFQYVPSDHGDDTQNAPDATPTKGRDRFFLGYKDTTGLAPGWTLITNINRASDNSYLHDFGSDLYTSSIGTLNSSTYIYGGGMWGKTYWNTSFGADDYQNVNPAVPDSAVQYKRWPRATFNVNMPLSRWFDAGLTSEAVAFRKDDVVQGNRLDLSPYIDADFQGAAWFVRPKLAWRYTGYELDSGYNNYNFYGPVTPGSPTPFTDRTPSRSLPIADIDSGLVFDRSTSFFGSDYTQTLEPRLYYLYVPYRNQNDLPVFDSGLMTFDTWQLFSTNQYSGADRQMNANNLSAALTSRLLDDNGVERLSITFGQIRYFAPQKVQLPNGPNTSAPITNWAGSDYVVNLSTQLNDDWRLNTDYQWNPNTRRIDVGELELQHRIGFDGVLNFSYRYRNGLLEQYSVSTVYPVSPRWRLVGAWTYSTMDRRTVEALGGVQYEGCCVKVSLVARHYVTGYDGLVTDPTTPPPGTTTAVMLELEFKGLGAFSGQTEDYLRRDILGYQ
ncbi:MAG: LPS assembly protein LptD [Rhodanobacter sp.]